MKKINLISYFVIIVAGILTSCTEELREFRTIEYVVCSNDNVVVDNTILTDFECQSNVSIASVTTIRNPRELGVNTSKFVGEYTDGTAENDGFIFDLSSAVSLSTNAFFNLKIKSEITGLMLVKLQGGTAAERDFSINISGNNQWTAYFLDLSRAKDEDHTEMKIIFNSGAQTNGDDVYLIDDLVLNPTIDPCENITPDLSIISDFECQQNYFFGDPNQNSSVEISDNLTPDMINNSSTVGLYKDNGTEPFDNLLIDFNRAIDLTDPLFKIKIYTSVAGNLLVKLEGGTAVEITKPITELNRWVEYTFNFKDAVGNGNTQLLLFFNAGATNGTAEDIYYIDDLRFEEFVDPCDGVAEDLSIINDFECQENYELNLDPANPAVVKVENPNPNTVNMGEFVGEYTDNGTEPFDNLLIDFNQVIDLSIKPEFNIKIHSSRTAPMLAKLEGGTTPYESRATIDVVGEWKNYKFDFSPAINNGNTRLVLFFNFEQTNGTETDFYYIDDLRFTESSNACPVIVENCVNTTQDLSIISDFDCQQNYFLGANPANTDAPVVQNPQVSCENRSSNVGSYLDNGMDPFDALFIDLGSPFDLSTKNQLKLKVFTTKAIPLLAKLEGGTAVEIQVTVDQLNEWAEYTIDFSSAIGNGNDKLVFFFNAGNTDGTAADQYYIDDIRFE